MKALPERAEVPFVEKTLCLGATPLSSCALTQCASNQTSSP